MTISNRGFDFVLPGLFTENVYATSLDSSEPFRILGLITLARLFGPANSFKMVLFTTPWMWLPLAQTGKFATLVEDLPRQAAL